MTKILYRKKSSKKKSKKEKSSKKKSKSSKSQKIGKIWLLLIDI